MPRPRYILPPLMPTRQWKRDACNFINSLPDDGEEAGQYSIQILPRRVTPSQEAYGYYYGCIVPTFARWLENTGQPLPEGIETFDAFAHAYLKRKKLLYPYTLTNGEIGCVVGSVARVNITSNRFWKYVDDGRGYMDETFGIPTDEPDKNWRMNGALALPRGVRAREGGSEDGGVWRRRKQNGIGTRC